MTNEQRGKYREIQVPCDREMDARAIQALNAHFEADDFHVVQNGTDLAIWLRQVNLDALADAAAKVAVAHPECATLTRIPEAVGAVKSYGLNGDARLYVGYNDERKVRDRRNKEKRRGKHYYANDHTFTAHVNPVPDRFVDSVVCGDSEEVLRNLPDNSIDLVFTSPPYNFGLEYGASADATHWDSYFDKLFRVFDECIRVVKFGGRIVVNVQPLFSDYIPSHHIISNYFMERHLIWKGEILLGKEQLQLQVHGLGQLEESGKPLPQVHVGVPGGLLQGRSPQARGPGERRHRFRFLQELGRRQVVHRAGATDEALRSPGHVPRGARASSHAALQLPWRYRP